MKRPFVLMCMLAVLFSGLTTMPFVEAWRKNEVLAKNRVVLTGQSA